MLTQKTAFAIANCHNQILSAEKLLVDINAEVSKIGSDEVGIRDVFGTRRRCMELGVPSGQSGHRILNVEYELAEIIIEAQILKYKQHLAALNIIAKSECDTDKISLE